MPCLILIWLFPQERQWELSGEPVHPRLPCPFPQCEVHLVLLFAHAVQLARVVYHISKVTTRQHTVAMVLVVLRYVEVNAAVAFVSVAVFHYLLHEFLLLNDVSCGARLY